MKKNDTAIIIGRAEHLQNVTWPTEISSYAKRTIIRYLDAEVNTYRSITEADTEVIYLPLPWSIAQAEAFDEKARMRYARYVTLITGNTLRLEKGKADIFFYTGTSLKRVSPESISPTLLFEGIPLPTSAPEEAISATPAS